MTRVDLKIESVEQLKKEAGEGAGFFIQLRNGVRSSKYISWNEEFKRFTICNEIDGSFQDLKEKHILKDSKGNIGAAIKLGALYKYAD